MSWFSDLLGGGDVRYSAQTRYSDTVKDWLVGSFSGIVTATGLRVTVADAKTVPGVSACIQVLSEDLAKVPLNVYQRTATGHRIAEEHRLQRLFRDGPAPWLTSFHWRRALLDTAMSHGNGFCRVHWTPMGEVDRITLVQPGAAAIKWGDEGEPFYDVSRQNGGVETGLTYQDVVHVPYRGSMDGAVNGGIWGRSPIEHHREAVALAIAAERFAAKFFANGARPSAVLEIPTKLPTDDVAKRMRLSLERAMSGVDNAFKIAVLELGSKLSSFSFNNADSQLIEIRKEQAVQMCTMFGVPPHKIGILDRATNNNIEHQGIDYVTGPVSSLAKSVEAALTNSCLTEREKAAGFLIEFDLDDLKRGDMLSRYRAYAIGRQWGWLNADEIREWESQNPLPDGKGQDYLVPLNMAPAGEPLPVDTGGDMPPQQSSLVGPNGEPLFIH